MQAEAKAKVSEAEAREAAAKAEAATAAAREAVLSDEVRALGGVVETVQAEAKEAVATAAEARAGAEVAALQAKVAEAEARADAAVAALQTKLAEAEEELTKKEETLRLLSDEVRALGDCCKEEAKLREKLQTVQAEAVAAQGRVEVLEREVENVRGELKAGDIALEKQATSLAGVRRELEEVRASGEAALSAVKEEMEEAAAELQERLDASQAELGAAQGRVQALEQSLEAVRGELEAGAKARGAAETQVVSLREREAGLEASLKGVKRELDEVRGSGEAALSAANEAQREASAREALLSEEVRALGGVVETTQTEAAAVAREAATAAARATVTKVINEEANTYETFAKKRKISGGSSWIHAFKDVLPSNFAVKAHALTKCITITGGGASLAVRPLETGMYQFRTPIASGGVMELVWADSYNALKLARMLGQVVGVSHVVNLSPKPPTPLTTHMTRVDVRHHVGDDVWVDRKVLMLMN